MSKKSHKNLGLTAKKENFSEWYSQVLQKAEMMDYTKVSGGIVIMPSAYYVWEKIQEFLNKKIKALGVKNVYFPSLIPESLLKKEKEHIRGFEPEVAWVTQAGNTKLSERLAIRPTSETIMYPSYAKWIRSYRDLPLKLNQWNNILRWEFKHPVPFLRTREFLWQEGHSAFATKEEASKEVKQILDIYEEIFRELLAVPVLKGKKSEKEKFAGADYTLSIEAFLPNKKAIQAATSHNLGQNFSKAFDINFLDKNKKKQYAWQTSWGLSTRSIGIMAAVHGDDKGIIFPPKVAPVHIVIVPIIFGKQKDIILKKSREIKNRLENYNSYLDDREEYSPGWKFNEWELKGVPLRIEIGPKEIQKKQAVVVRRDTLKKETVKLSALNKKIKSLLEDIQKNLLKKAEKFLKESIVSVKNIDEAKTQISKGKIAKVKWCGTAECEDEIKIKTGYKVLNISLTERPSKKSQCFGCKMPASSVAYIGRSY